MPSASELRQKLEAECQERQRREQEEKEREDAMLLELAAAEEAERVAEEKQRLEEERRRAQEQEMRLVGEARRKIAEANQKMEMTVEMKKRALTAGPSSPAKAGRSTEVETVCWFCRSKGHECVRKV
jgi:hypothetical protein